MEPPRQAEVINLNNSFNLQKAVGHDNIFPYYLGIASTILAPALCYLFDYAFKLGIFPYCCKIAKISSLFKAGKTDQLTIYRPLSILTCFSKILEN